MPAVDSLIDGCVVRTGGESGSHFSDTCIIFPYPRHTHTTTTSGRPRGSHQGGRDRAVLHHSYGRRAAGAARRRRADPHAVGHHDEVGCSVVEMWSVWCTCTGGVCLVSFLRIFVYHGFCMYGSRFPLPIPAPLHTHHHHNDTPHTHYASPPTINPKSTQATNTLG